MCKRKSFLKHLLISLIFTDHVSVAMVLDPCFPQVFENVDFHGGDYRTFFTANFEECQRICTLDPVCQFFTFVTGNFTTLDVR